MKNLEELKKIIKKHDVISFDIFDTLILRNVESPTDIFKIIEKKYCVRNFYEKRIKAEADSRIGQKNYESNLDRIYDFLQKMYSKSIKDIKEKEMSIEYEFICQNQSMKKIFDYCVINNKKIFLISDMYLSKKFIKKLLKKCGYENYNDIYISNEIGESKHIGGLYDFVGEKNHINKNTWLHIGDNIYSDVQVPTEKGITTYHYKNVKERVERKSKTNSIEQSIFRGIQNNYLLNNDLNYWEIFGIKYISALYYGFTNWLVNLTKNDDNVYFLSRDGYVVKKVYEIFKNKLNLNIDLRYLYTSRLAYQVPINVFYNKEIALRTFTDRNVAFGHYLTINEVFELLELDPNKFKNYIKTFGFTDDYDKKIEDEEIESLKKLILSIYEIIKTQFECKLKLLKEYLKQEGLEKYKKVNLVDVGWRGSIQESIKRLLEDSTVYGYYFGINEYVWEDIKNESFGFAIDQNIHNEERYFIMDNIMMFELIFSSSQGSLLGFKKSGKKIVPVLEKTGDTENCIDIFQNSALKIIDLYLNYYDYLKYCNIKDVIQDYKDFINFKSFKDVNKFSELTNDVGLTSKKKKYVETYEEKNISKNYEEFKKKIGQSLWKNSFLIKEISNEKDYEHLKTGLYNYEAARKYNKINKDVIIKAINNPKKAIEVMKIKINNKKNGN